MNYRHGLLPLILLSLLGTSACNLPGPASGPSLDEQAATVVALTLEAERGQQIPPLGGGTPSGPKPGSSTPTLTPTFSVPMLQVSEGTNCRTGPGVAYERVLTVQTDDPVEIVGSLPPDYWLVKAGNETCWLWAEFATPSGSYQAVPTLTAPPTPTGVPPQAPSIRRWDFFCANGQADVTIQWSDKADNESGYRIFRNGEQVAEVAANTEIYVENINLLSGQSAGYTIEAYNFVGTARSTVVTITCP